MESQPETQTDFDIQTESPGGIRVSNTRLPISILIRCLYYLEPHDLHAVARTSRAMAECVRSVAQSLRLRAERDLALRSVEQAFQTAGYRKGIEIMEDRLLQHGFNEGFIFSSGNNLQIGIQRGIATALSLFFKKSQQGQAAAVLTRSCPDVPPQLQLLNHRINALARELDFPASMCTVYPDITHEECKLVRNSRVGVPIFDIDDPKSGMSSSTVQPEVKTAQTIRVRSTTDVRITSQTDFENEESESVVSRGTAIQKIPPRSSQSQSQPMASIENSNSVTTALPFAQPTWRQDLEPQRYDGLALARKFARIVDGTTKNASPMPESWQIELASCIQSLNEAFQQYTESSEAKSSVALASPQELSQVWLSRAATEQKRLELKAKGIFIDATINDVYPPQNPGLIERTRISPEDLLLHDEEDDESGRSSRRDTLMTSTAGSSQIDEVPSLEGIDFM